MVVLLLPFVLLTISQEVHSDSLRCDLVGRSDMKALVEEIKIKTQELILNRI